MTTRSVRHPLVRACCAGIAVLLGVAPVIAEDTPVEKANDSSAIGAVIPLQDEITDIMVETIRRRINEAREAGARTIIFDMNTPGGLVSSSIDIADAIKELTDIKTIAWVNPNAHSGGALVAVACSEIIMSRSSRLGNAQVIMFGEGGAEAVPQNLQPKAYTPVVTEFRASAKLRGYNQVLCEAFVVPEREVWWLENSKTGERDFFSKEDKERLLAPPAKAEGAEVKAEPEWKLVEKYFDPVLGKEVSVTQPVDRADQNLEMSAGEAFAYGFSKAVVSSREELQSRYALSKLITIDVTWSESLAAWLTSAYVRGFLLAVIMLAIYVEFHTPGLGLAGLVALIGLTIFVVAPYLTGLANVWEILVIVIGLVFIAIEFFVIPGFGIAGISGLVLLMIGLLATFVPDEPGRTLPFYLPSLEGTKEALKIGVVTVSSSMIASLVGMVILSRFMPKIPMFRALIPDNPTPSEVLVDDPYHGAARVGDLGESVGPLRPAGKAQFGPILVDVVTQGEFVESGGSLEVVERRGNRVVVRQVGSSSR